jgi:predicted nucleotidyltransferase
MKAENFEPMIKNAIAKHIDLNESFVFLFGSRAGGGSRLSSDYDIGLYRGRKIPLGIIAKIKDELENYPIPVEIDLVDFSLVSDAFKSLALQQVKIWNKPKTGLKLT